MRVTRLHEGGLRFSHGTHSCFEAHKLLTPQ